MKGFIFEGYNVYDQGVYYADYSCPFCSGSVALLRFERTTSIGETAVFFRGRCARCGADGPKEKDSLDAMDHFKHREHVRFGGGIGIGTILPERIIRKFGERPSEIHVPFRDSTIPVCQGTGTINMPEVSRVVVAVYRIIDTVEDGTVYEYQGVKHA